MTEGEAMSAPAVDCSPAIASLLVVHRPLAKRENEYEEWLRDVREACRSFPGHLGADVIRPVNRDGGAYTVVVRFASRSQLDVWLRSPARFEAARQLSALLTTQETLRVSVGDDVWFTADASSPAPPRRYKQFLLTFSFLFPMSLTVQPVISNLAGFIGLAPDALMVKAAVTAALVGLLLWVVFPVVTPRLRRWLTT